MSRNVFVCRYTTSDANLLVKYWMIEKTSNWRSIMRTAIFQASALLKQVMELLLMKKSHV